MAENKKWNAIVTSQIALTEEIRSLWLTFPEECNIPKKAVPGQFISMYSQDGSRLLPRPISICECNKEEHLLRVVYRIVGQGTEEFAKKKAGDVIPVVGPLGNGFTMEDGEAVLIGGGIGIPPMLELAKQLSKTQKVKVVLGYRDDNLFLKNEFEPYADVFVSTEDGSVGTKGNVVDCMKENGITKGSIYACGPIPMLRGIKAYALEQGMEAQVSMEEKMACGIGACLGCVCKTKEKDAHSHVHNARICKDGPVFRIEDIEL